MDVIIKISALAVTGTVLALLLKRDSPELSLLLAICVACTVLAFSFNIMSTVVGFIRTLAESAGVSAAAVSVVLKTVAVAIVTRITCEICNDAGHGAVSSAVETAGSCVAFYISIPLIKTVFETIRSFL